MAEKPKQPVRDPERIKADLFYVLTGQAKALRAQRAAVWRPASKPVQEGQTTNSLGREESRNREGESGFQKAK